MGAGFATALLAVIGLSMALQQFGILMFSSYTKWIVVPSSLSGTVTLWGASVSWLRLSSGIIGVALIVILLLFIRFNKIGHAMLAIPQDADASALQGINVNRISSLVVAIGCALAAVAGGLMGALLSLSPTMGSFALMKGMAVIILGGIGSLPGAIIGSLIIGLIDGIVPNYLNITIATIFGFAAIIIILLVRPKGLMGHD